MNGFSNHARGEGALAAAAIGCLAGLSYGAILAVFFFDRYSVVGNVYPVPQGAGRAAFSVCLALVYASIGTCAGAVVAALAWPLRWCAEGRPGYRALIPAVAIGLFFWAKSAIYLNGCVFVFEWGRRVYVRGWRLRAGLVEPRVLAANALLAFACLAAAAGLWVFLKRVAAPRARAAALCAAFLFASLVVEVNYRLPAITTMMSLAGNCALLALCAAAGWLFAVAGGRVSGKRLRWAALLAPPALVLFLLVWRDPDAKAIFFLMAPPAARVCLLAINAVFDRDRDYFSPLTPVTDCNNRDANVNPLAVDLPGNGVDEDCFGGDFTDQEFARWEGERARREAHNARAAREGEELRMRLWGEKMPDIYFVCVDALRSDHVSLNGYRRATTPEMDALFREGVFFPRCITPASVTNSSLPAMFTSRYPSQLAGKNAEGAVTLQRLLGDAGYRTAIFHSITPPEPGFSPFAKKGFDYCFEPGLEKKYRVSAGEVTGKVERFIEEYQGGKPLFSVIWYSDTHASYPSPPPFRFMFGSVEGAETIFIPRGNEPAWMELQYDRAIAYADSEIGRLVRFLRKRGSLNRAVIVLTGDHGEEFYEHGGLYHGVGLHGELTTVPLGFLVPGLETGGTAFRETVQSLDIMPTLCAFAGVRIPDGVEGWSLVSAVARGDAPPERSIISETIGRYPFRLMALVQGEYRLIHDFYSGTDLLYNIGDDPAERRDIAREDPLRAYRMARDAFNLKSFLDIRCVNSGAQRRN